MNKILLIMLMMLLLPRTVFARERFFQIQSIDTMKYSRDLAREKLNHPEFDQEIETQVKNIAETGATHIAIGTPYDDEFLPYLKRWVGFARKYRLKVWFRGNFSGWEQWFGYPRINREKHLLQTEYFILSNSSLFEDGDIFTSCPECEFGGPGDPRKTGDVKEFRNFIISHYRISRRSFFLLNKKVAVNYQSMNTDVARLIMDKDTTRLLGGVVVIDHFVSTPEKLVKDIGDLAKKTGGQIVLGEFGAPIPDIHGAMDESQQAEWIAEALRQLIPLKELIGVNYWVNQGGSTGVWDNNDQPLRAVTVLTSYFKPDALVGTVKNEYSLLLAQVAVNTDLRSAVTDRSGRYRLPIMGKARVTFVKEGYRPVTVKINSNSLSREITKEIVLNKTRPSLILQLIGRLQSLLKRFIK